MAALRRLNTTDRLVYGATFVYAVVFAALADARHLAFLSQRDDLGNMTQAVWSTAHGHLLETTTNSGRNLDRLGIHSDVFLVLLVPFWWVWSSPLMLLTLQALVVPLGALPVYWLGRKHLGRRQGAFFAFAYLVYPVTQFNTFAVSSGFHAVSLAIPLLLFAIWFLDEDRLVAFAIVALLAATTKEEIPLIVGMLGIWYGSRTGRWRVGLSIFGLGLAATLVAFLVVIPHFDGGHYLFGGRYDAVGGSPGGIARHVFTDPTAFVSAAASTHKLAFVLLLFVPFLGLWLLEPLLVLCVVPELVLSLLSSDPNQSSLAFHNPAAIVPFVFAATVLGLARLGRQVKRLSLYVLAACIATAIYSPLWLGVQHLDEALPSNPVHQVKAHALSLIPQRVPVSASNQLGAHLAERRRLLVFPFAIGEARWVVVDAADPTYDQPGVYRRRIAALRANRAWRVVYDQRGVTVFEKR